LLNHGSHFQFALLKNQNTLVNLKSVGSKKQIAKKFSGFSSVSVGLVQQTFYIC